ncbi:MipA/OmpV family protein [Rhizobium sp. S153]|uniref:MipA/OmpV family protein n=1 Tax=Ciceribacter sichuanensis TaxID=2949647 RepID=A0ABT0VBX4_9HYPH|nr:MipA/OmpV family protein [Ciceribacter sp. S153]MCM2402492.1 MipA/OmpV family protein [Ciceribacter sp. S153]
MFLVRQNHLRVSSFALSTALGITGMAAGAFAADPSEPEPPQDMAFDNARMTNEPVKPDWSLIVGGGGIYEPEYEGSDEFKISPVPFVVFTYGEWLEIDPSGVTVTPLRYGDFALSANVGYESGRDDSDHADLRGLGDIDFAATLGAKASYEWGPVEFYAAVDQTLGGSESLIGTVGIGYSAPVTERLILEANAEAILANDKHMEAYFGVNAAQSAASGLPQYKAEAGLKRVEVSVAATYLLSENWLIRGQAGLGILSGDAADSPIVKEKLQPSAQLFLGYKF